MIVLRSERLLRVPLTDILGLSPPWVGSRLRKVTILRNGAPLGGGVCLEVVRIMNRTINLVGLTRENLVCNCLAEMPTSCTALWRRSFPLICKRLCLTGYILFKTSAELFFLVMILVPHLTRQRFQELNEIIFSSKISTLDSSEDSTHECEERCIAPATTARGMNPPIPKCQIRALIYIRVAQFI